MISSECSKFDNPAMVACPGGGFENCIHLSTLCDGQLSCAAEEAKELCGMIQKLSKSFILLIMEIHVHSLEILLNLNNLRSYHNELINLFK